MLHSELLAQIPLFDTLAASDLEALGQRMTERLFKSGEKVFDKDDEGSSMYIVLSGAVQIFLPGGGPDDPPVVLKDARTGEYFGELSLFDDKPRSASVSATVDTTLLELTRSDFGDHISRSRTAAMTILAEMAERLRETNALLSQRAARDVVKEFEENLTWGQRLADKVAELNGSWAFILFLLAILAQSDVLHPLQRAFVDNFALQCGFCTPGFLMMAKSLLERNPDPSEDDVRDYLDGNICRCTGYRPIVEAVLDAAREMRGEKAHG